jgi:hypothetical protein
MDMLQLTGQNLGRVFNSRHSERVYDVPFKRNNETAKLKVKKLVQATFRFSPVSFNAPRLHSSQQFIPPLMNKDKMRSRQFYTFCFLTISHYHRLLIRLDWFIHLVLENLSDIEGTTSCGKTLILLLLSEQKFELKRFS